MGNWKSISAPFDENDDADLIKWLQEQPTTGGTIREVMRAYFAGKLVSIDEPQPEAPEPAQQPTVDIMEAFEALADRIADKLAENQKHETDRIISALGTLRIAAVPGAEVTAEDDGPDGINFNDPQERRLAGSLLGALDNYTEIEI